MTNPDRDPEHSSPPESGFGGTPPPPGGYAAPAYGQPSYPPPPGPDYPPPPPGYPPYGSFGAPYETPAAYPPPPPGYPPYGGAYPTGQKTNTLAIWSLVASLIGFICCIGSVVGIALGLVSLNQLKQTQEDGQGLAIAGIAIGAVSLLAGLLMTVVLMNS